MASQRSDDVIEAAIRVFGRQSYSATSVQDVADALNMPKGTLYHYIRSKEDLLAEIFRRASQDVQDLMAEVSGLQVPPVERLSRFVRGYAHVTLVNLERTTIYSREWRYLSGPLRTSVIDGRVRLDEFLIRLIQDVGHSGAADGAIDPKRIAYFLWGALSSIPDWYRRGGRETPEQVADSYAVLALRTVFGAAPAELPPSVDPE
jgi:AcrR family transcriptional regulator